MSATIAYTARRSSQLVNGLYIHKFLSVFWDDFHFAEPYSEKPAQTLHGLFRASSVTARATSRSMLR